MHEIKDLPFEIILIREKQSQNYPKFKTIHIPIVKWIPGFASLRLFFLVPLACIWMKANIVFEPAHFGPFNLPPWIKRVTVIHDLTPILFPEWHPFSGWFLHRLFIPGILRRSHLIIADSYSTKNDINRIVSKVKEKIRVIHLGISKNFQPIQNLTTLRKLKTGSEFILSVGTIEPRKNHKLVLKAFELLKEDIKYNNLKWVIVGRKGWKIDNFIENARNSKFEKDIIFTGQIDLEELIHLYSQCSVFIYPSHYEGFGFPILESMACGAYIITTKNSSISEIGRKYVDYVNDNDYVQVVQLIKNRLEKDYNLDLEKVKYAKSYTWEKYAVQLLEQLKTLT